MKIKSIHLYSKNGERRDLPFHLDGLNVITGRSSTGKSALSDIIEYCMGRSSFNVAEGVIREKVAWYSVLFQFENEQVFVAKPTPPHGGETCSNAMYRRGVNITIPEFHELQQSADDDAVESLLTRLLGIPENRIDVPTNNTRATYDANVKHTLYYLFQKQTLVANKDILLYRQNEPFQPQAIKDTLPILLGVSSRNRYELEVKLRAVQRDFKLSNKLLEQAKNNIDTSQQRAISLYSEAQAVGLLGPRQDSVPLTDIVELLRGALRWRPTSVPDADTSRVGRLESEILDLRKERRDVQARTDAAQQYARKATGFQSEAAEQRDRLASIKAFPKNPATGEWQWPFCEANLSMESPIATVLLAELTTLDKELDIVFGERPQLEAYIAENEQKVRELSESIRNKELELAAAISANELLAQMGSRNNAAARVVGRVSLFLEGLTPDSELDNLLTENRRLQAKVAELERRINADNSQDRLDSILNNISTQVSKYVDKLEGEFKIYPARFDLKNLTVTFDRVERSIPMSKSGGGENHLAYHLSALLALHWFAVKNNRPIPRFLLIDQPTQVYFPSIDLYEAAGGDVEKTEEDADIVSVRRLFKFLLEFTQKEAPGFQIIVTEHANLRDDWFQAALVEPPWRKPPALVPEDWPDIG